MPDGAMPLLLALLLFRLLLSRFRLLLSRCCHSLAATAIVAGCQIAHARDKSFYQWRTLVVLWVAQQLAE